MTGITFIPAAIRVAFSIFGEDRICLISDAMMACGMPNGEYELGGQKVTMKVGLATLASGTIAGSATPLSECFRRAVINLAFRGPRCAPPPQTQPGCWVCRMKSAPSP